MRLLPLRRSARSRRRRPSAAAPRRRRCAHARLSLRTPRRTARTQPLVTRWCSMNSGVLLTRLVTRTMRSTLSRSPIAAWRVPSRSMATGARRLLAGGGRHVLAELADPGLAVALGDVAGEIDEVARAHEGHVRAGRDRQGRQGDVEVGESVVDRGHGGQSARVGHKSYTPQVHLPHRSAAPQGVPRGDEPALDTCRDHSCSWMSIRWAGTWLAAILCRLARRRRPAAAGTRAVSAGRRMSPAARIGPRWRSLAALLRRGALAARAPSCRGGAGGRSVP